MLFVIVFISIAEEPLQQLLQKEKYSEANFPHKESWEIQTCLYFTTTRVSVFVCSPQVDSPVGKSQSQLTSCLYQPSAITSSAKVSSSYPPTSSVNPTIVLLQHSRGKHQPLNTSGWIKSKSIMCIKNPNAFMM